ncbi:OadG family protein [Fervidobacterium sp.]
MLQEVIVTIVGVTTVFIVFVILYIIFKLMEFFGISKDKKVKIPSRKEIKETSGTEKSTLNVSQNANTFEVEDSEEIAAVFAAIYATLGTDVVVHSVKKVGTGRVSNLSKTKGQRGWEEWRTYGWRGGNR